jgi:hypothetical protein
LFLKIANLSNSQGNCSVFFIPFSYNFNGTDRYELDQLDTQDKYPGEFMVTLDVIVGQKDRPRAGVPMPWADLKAKTLSPKILFSTKDELLMVTSDFGEALSPLVACCDSRSILQV